jgi:catechol-2,3-dioxygenase
VTSLDGMGQSAPITGLSHLQLLVSDVAASAKWYSAVLGLAPFADDPDIG